VLNQPKGATDPVKKTALIIIPLLVLALAAGSFAGCAKKDDDTSKQLASVNNVKVSENQLNTRVSIFKIFYGPSIDTADARSKILDQLIEEEVILQEATKQKVKPTADEVKNEFSGFMEQLVAQYGDKEKTNTELKGLKLTEADLQVFIERYLVIQGLYTKVTEKVTVPDSEIQKYYDDNKAEFLEEENVRVRHILLKTKEEAQKLLPQLQKGADFADLAKKNSIDPGSKDQGGELPRFGRGEMYEEFEAAAFALQVGKLSGVVQTPAGFHIIKMEERFPERQQLLAEVKDQIKDSMLEERRSEAFEKYVAELKAKAKVNKGN
jgi:foldase protein PrsA